MIPDIKICAVLEQEFPELDFNSDVCPRKDMYGYMTCISQRAHQLICNNQMLPLQHCIQLMSKLHKHCSRRVQAAIENVFLYQFTRSLHRSDRRWEIKQILPNAFRDVMYRHVFCGAI